MPGLGQAFLPKPAFSTDNPYWVDPARYWGWLPSQFWPKLSARDYLYATTWEIRRWDVHGAYCSREALINTIKVQWRFWLHQIIEQYVVTLKEKKRHENQAA
jgi:hypothetical protein